LPEAGQDGVPVDVQRGDDDQRDDAERWVHDVSAEGSGGCIVC
jgi:hypothetical protein